MMRILIYNDRVEIRDDTGRHLVDAVESVEVVRADQTVSVPAELVWARVGVPE